MWPQRRQWQLGSSLECGGDNFARILAIKLRWKNVHTHGLLYILTILLMLDSKTSQAVEDNRGASWRFQLSTVSSSVEIVMIQQSMAFNSHRSGDSVSADASFLRARRGKWTWFSSQPSWGFTSSWKDSPQNSFCLAWTASMAFWASFPWSRCLQVAAIFLQSIEVSK